MKTLQEPKKQILPMYFLPFGRINGSIWFLRNIINIMTCSLLSFPIFLLPESMHFLTLIPGAFWFYLYIVTCVKRLHDWNLRGWWLIIGAFFPLVFWLFWLVPGKKSANSFGEKINGVCPYLYSA